MDRAGTTGRRRGRRRLTRQARGIAWPGPATPTSHSTRRCEPPQSRQADQFAAMTPPQGRDTASFPSLRHRQPLVSSCGADGGEGEGVVFELWRTRRGAEWVSLVAFRSACPGDVAPPPTSSLALPGDASRRSRSAARRPSRRPPRSRLLLAVSSSAEPVPLVVVVSDGARQCRWRGPTGQLLAEGRATPRGSAVVAEVAGSRNGCAEALTAAAGGTLLPFASLRRLLLDAVEMPRERTRAGCSTLGAWCAGCRLEAPPDPSAAGFY